MEKLKPKLVWYIFENVLAATPRESKKEEKIRRAIKDWVQKRAKEDSITLSIREDSVGNILIKKPATEGMEFYPSLMLQAHLDMVCETNKPNGYDFDNKGIPLRIQKNGEWIDADGTTLGADNGIGVAIALALLFDKDEDYFHGPLEILLTIDEETGLTGAFGLDVEGLEIKSKLFINLDSEELGIITIGSAGGGQIIFEKEIKLIDPLDSEKYRFIELKVLGLLGGHSGGEIHLPRANANKLIARCLSAIIEKVQILLCNWNGPSKFNVITRESTAIFAVPIDKMKKFEEILVKETSVIRNYYQNPAKDLKQFEPEIRIEWKIVEREQAFSYNDTQSIIFTANAIPHGVIRYSPTITGLVETSLNFAIISIEEMKNKSQNKNLKIIFGLSARSNIDEELETFRRSLANLGVLGKWKVIKKPAYPAWTPIPTGSFLQMVKEVYESLMKKSIKIKAIHAGLEAGVIGSKIPDIQMVSVGPLIKGCHTPNERLKIADVGVIYKLLKIVMKKINSLHIPS
ncbi:MAG: beta-Ala-His dipeptidase [Promethearchaeota archaeon]